MLESCGTEEVKTKEEKLTCAYLSITKGPTAPCSFFPVRFYRTSLVKDSKAVKADSREGG